MKTGTRIKAGLVAFLFFGGGSSPAVAHAIHPPSRHAAPARTARTAQAGRGEGSFTRAVLTDLGAPRSAANIASLETWYRHEWPSWPPSAANNPLDSTLWRPGATAFNTLPGGGHVWNYPTATEGALATAATLENGRYPQILAALRAGRGLCGSSVAVEVSTWSAGGYSVLC